MAHKYRLESHNISMVILYIVKLDEKESAQQGENVLDDKDSDKELPGRSTCKSAFI